MEELALTYGTLRSNDKFISRMISRDNLKEIIEVINRTINYLTESTVIILQKIDEKWYVN